MFDETEGPRGPMGEPLSDRATGARAGRRRLYHTGAGSLASPSRCHPGRAEAVDQAAGSGAWGQVIIVEDDDALGEILQMIVLSDGRRASVARNLGQARRLLSGPVPADAVLLDLHLGLELGADLLPDIRRRAPEAPIVVMTGLDTPELASWARGEGLTLALKPFDGDWLLGHLAARLGGRTIAPT